MKGYKVPGWRPLASCRRNRATDVATPMFDSLTERLTQALRNFRGVGQLSEENMAEALARGPRPPCFPPTSTSRSPATSSNGCSRSAPASEVLKGVAPGQQVVKVIHDELVRLLGEGTAGLPAARPLRS